MRRTLLRGWNVQAKGEDCCRVCGMGQGQGLHLHHIVSRAICTLEAKQDLRNGIPLCFLCHERVHQGMIIPRRLLREDEWEYVSGLTLTGRETGAWLDKHYPETGPAQGLRCICGEINARHCPVHSENERGQA